MDVVLLPISTVMFLVKTCSSILTINMALIKMLKYIYCCFLFKASNSNKSKRQLTHSEISKGEGKNVPRGVLCVLKGHFFFKSRERKMARIPRKTAKIISGVVPKMEYGLFTL